MLGGEKGHAQRGEGKMDEGKVKMEYKKASARQTNVV